MELYINRFNKSLDKLADMFIFASIEGQIGILKEYYDKGIDKIGEKETWERILRKIAEWWVGNFFYISEFKNKLIELHPDWKDFILKLIEKINEVEQ